MSAREIDVTERPEVPWLSIVLGYGPMLPFVAGAAVSFSLDGGWRPEAILLTGLDCDRTTPARTQFCSA